MAPEAPAVDEGRWCDVTGAQPEAGGASQWGNNGDTFAQPHPGAPPLPPCSPSLPLRRVSTGGTEGLAWSQGPEGGGRLPTHSGRVWRGSLLAGGRRLPLAPGHMAPPTRHLAASEQVGPLGPARQRPGAPSPDCADDIAPRLEASRSKGGDATRGEPGVGPSAEAAYPAPWSRWKWSSRLPPFEAGLRLGHDLEE